jgi:Rap1a immunity proteins
MRVIRLLGVAMLGLWPSLAFAMDSTDITLKTTEDLYQVCSVPADNPDHSRALSFCEGFLLATASYDYAISDRAHLRRFICPPDTATRDEGIQAFIDWAKANLQNEKYMNAPPVEGAVRGLAAKWPCK